MTRRGILLNLIVAVCVLWQLSATAQEQPSEELKALSTQLDQFYKEGKYAEAIPIAKKLLAITEEKYGPDNMETAAALSTLANYYRYSGRYAEAEPLYKRALRIGEAKLGKGHLFVALSLNNLALLYKINGQHGEAEQAYKRSLAIYEANLGEDHPYVAISLNNLGRFYQDAGRYAEAEPLYKRALAIRETKLGRDHLDVAESLNNLAALYQATGRYAEAEPLFKRALAIGETKLGEDHLFVALYLSNLALLYKETGCYAEAEPLYKRALAIREKKLGRDHPDVAVSLNNLAGLYQATSRYAEAEPLFKESLEIREKKFGRDHPDVARALNSLAGLYWTTGRYAEAERLYKESLEIRKARLGESHPDVARVMNNLAVLYKDTGQFSEAEALNKGALAIRETKLGKNHPDVAQSMHNLAALYQNTGRYAEAEPLYKKAQDIYRARLGEDHPEVAKALNGLAGLYRITGRYTEAEPLYKESVEIREKKLGKDHPDVAKALNGLAGVCRETGRYKEAEQLYRRSLEIGEVALGKDHPDIATYLNNLALFFHVTERYAQAEPLYKRSLEIREARLGEDHPDVANLMNNLAGLYQNTGHYAGAEPLYKRSLEIRQARLGKDHPDVAITLENLAVLYAANEKYDLSRQYLYQSINILEKERENVFLLLEEKQKLSFMARNKRSIVAFFTTISRNLQKDGNGIQDALNAWLRWKGAVTEFQGRLTEACVSSEKPEVTKNCAELDNVRRTLASLMNSRPEKMDVDTYRQILAQYNEKKRTLETELSRLSADFRLEKLVGTADIAAIAAILPKESAYLDFSVFTPYDFKQDRFELQPRLLAFVLIPGDPPRVNLLDLGDAEAIDRPIREYHKVIQAAVSRKRAPDIDAVRQHFKALYGLVWEPLLPYIQGRKQFFVSPDGSLNLIPFEAFITSGGKYLVEEYSIQYIAAGRDIVRLKDEAKAQGGALIIADPNYDLGETERAQVAKHLGLSLSPEVPSARPKDVKVEPFPRLSGTKEQAERIKNVIGGVTRQYEEALQEVLFSAQYPKVLHIATHGYFLPDQKIAPQWGPGSETPPPDALKAYENPMLRSGIALAGANTSQREGKDYGLVSAEKVLGLKLKGTDLVVLSACQTGVGDIQTGEGVFGLKRAFILSGARTVVMSLWSVPSTETTELMGSFYTKWSKGKSKAEALREAKLEMMKENPNPFFWGAFVMVGDPGKMAEKTSMR